MKATQRIEIAISSLVQELMGIVDELARAELRSALDDSSGAARRPSSGQGRRKAPAGAAPAAARKQARRPRRSLEEVGQIQSLVLQLLIQQPGLSSEEIQEKLGLEKEDLQHPITLLRTEHKVRVEGQRRSMRYFVGAGKPGVVRRVRAETTK